MYSASSTPPITTTKGSITTTKYSITTTKDDHLMVISSRLSPSPQQRNHINSQTFPSWIITSNIMENLLHYGSSDDESASTFTHPATYSSTSSTCSTITLVRPSAATAAAEAKKKKNAEVKRKAYDRQKAQREKTADYEKLLLP